MVPRAFSSQAGLDLEDTPGNFSDYVTEVESVQRSAYKPTEKKKCM